MDHILDYYHSMSILYTIGSFGLTSEETMYVLLRFKIYEKFEKVKLFHSLFLKITKIRV